MPETNLIEAYIQTLTDRIDHDGIYPMPAIYSGTELTMVSYACGAQQYIRDAMRRCLEATECMIGLDIYTSPGQGTELDSAVILFHITREQARIGVLEYTATKSPVTTKPVNWQNEFWNSQYRDLVTKMQQRIISRDVF